MLICENVSLDIYLAHIRLKIIWLSYSWSGERKNKIKEKEDSTEEEGREEEREIWEGGSSKEGKERENES